MKAGHHFFNSISQFNITDVGTIIKCGPQLPKTKKFCDCSQITLTHEWFLLYQGEQYRWLNHTLAFMCGLNLGEKCILALPQLQKRKASHRWQDNILGNQVVDIFRVPPSSSSLKCILKDQLAILEAQLKVGEQSEKIFTKWKLSLQNSFRHVHIKWTVCTKIQQNKEALNYNNACSVLTCELSNHSSIIPSEVIMIIKWDTDVTVNYPPLTLCRP